MTLKSLENHNRNTYTKLLVQPDRNPPSGFACPKCGEEMNYQDTHMTLASNPPKKQLNCNGCGHIDYLVI